MARSRISRRLGVLVAAAAACTVAVQPGAASAAPPANDALADATEMASLPFSSTVDVTEATTEPGEPAVCQPVAGSAWFRVEASDTQTLRLALTRADPYVQFAVYEETGAGLSGLTAVSGCGGQFQPVVVPAAAGDVLYAQVLRTHSFGSPQTAQLEVSVVPPPANDAFAAASTITALPFAGTVDASAASVEAGEPSLCTFPASEKTVWYQYTPSTDGSLRAAPGFSSAVAVYVGPSLDDLTLVGCQTFMPLTFRATAGTTYSFQVGPAGFFPGPGAPQVQLSLDVAPPPSAAFSYHPPDPSSVEPVTFFNHSWDPAGTPLSAEWDFGDGTASTESSPNHHYAADGDYTTTLTVTAPDGRRASTSQLVQVRTHDVQIVRFVVPNKASAGQTVRFTIGVTNSRYPDNVEVSLYKSVPGGDFVLVGSAMQSVPVRESNRTSDFRIDYTFSAADAAAPRVTFKAVATVVSHRDALPADNTAISFPVTVRA